MTNLCFHGEFYIASFHFLMSHLGFEMNLAFACLWFVKHHFGFFIIDLVAFSCFGL